MRKAQIKKEMVEWWKNGVLECWRNGVLNSKIKRLKN
jgi:hypothetical protein